MERILIAKYLLPAYKASQATLIFGFTHSEAAKQLPQSNNNTNNFFIHSPVWREILHKGIFNAILSDL
jgi:hypothetical protein